MFRTISASLLALSISALSSTAFSVTAEPAKVTANEKVRKAIDDICGDTWCEGDFQYKFGRVTFNKKNQATTVNFVMSPYIDDQVVGSTDGFEATVGKTSFAVKCVVKGYSDAALIVKENGSLDEGFYTSLSSCINSIEDALNARI